MDHTNSRRPKRYKKPLYANYNPHEVSQKTRNRWENNVPCQQGILCAYYIYIYTLHTYIYKKLISFY